MSDKKWVKRDGCSSIEEAALRNLGVKTGAKVDDWERKFITDSYYIKNMDKAVSMAKDLIHKEYSFTILGDYDADGITGTIILAMGLKAIGVKDIGIVIPDRITDGYGAKEKHVDLIKEKDNGNCLIFVDNGIACNDALQRAKERGFKTIILDHHLSSGKEVLNMADVVVDPEAEEGLYGKVSSGFDSYCGAGLAFSFIRKLLHDPVMIDKLLCFAAIGTVCDIMPLREENFCIVKHGLKLMEDKNTCTTGLWALTCALDKKDSELTAKDLGFSYGPVINAQSRLHGRRGVYETLNLLAFDGAWSSDAANEARSLIETNFERKRLQKEGIEAAERAIEDENLSADHPLVVYIPGSGEGVVGIVASNIAEKYKIPAIVLTDSRPEGVIKGSGRSYGNYNMIESLKPASDLLLSCGGHPGACGLSLKRNDLYRLRKILSDTFPEDYVFEDSDTVYYDLEISTDEVHEAIDKLEQYGPFGKGHDEIIFKINDFKIVPDPYYINILSDGKSARLTGENCKAFAFKNADLIHGGIRSADIIGTLSKNYYRGRVSDRIEIIDIKESESAKKDVKPAEPMPDTGLGKILNYMIAGNA